MGWSGCFGGVVVLVVIVLKFVEFVFGFIFVFVVDKLLNVVVIG